MSLTNACIDQQLSLDQSSLRKRYISITIQSSFQLIKMVGHESAQFLVFFILPHNRRLLERKHQIFICIFITTYSELEKCARRTKATICLHISFDYKLKLWN